MLIGTRINIDLHYVRKCVYESYVKRESKEVVCNKKLSNQIVRQRTFTGVPATVEVGCGDCDGWDSRDVPKWVNDTSSDMIDSSSDVWFKPKWVPCVWFDPNWVPCVWMWALSLWGTWGVCVWGLIVVDAGVMGGRRLPRSTTCTDDARDDRHRFACQKELGMHESIVIIYSKPQRQWRWLLARLFKPTNNLVKMIVWNLMMAT